MGKHFVVFSVFEDGPVDNKHKYLQQQHFLQESSANSLAEFLKENGIEAKVIETVSNNMGCF